MENARIGRETVKTFGKLIAGTTFINFYLFILFFLLHKNNIQMETKLEENNLENLYK